MTPRRVVITGLGAVTPLGSGISRMWPRLLAGESGIDTITKFDASIFTTQIAGEVRDFNPTDHMDAREAKRMDIFAHYGVASGLEAAQDSGLDLEKCDADRVGVILGCGIGGILEIEQTHLRMLDRGPDRVSPHFVPKLMVNAVCAHLSMKLKARGPNFAVASACASAAHAQGTAYRCIQMGDADAIITGGAEATVTPLGLVGFCAARALSTRNDEPKRASRPFDLHRDGFVMGEGSGALVFEELEHAKARGARIYAEVVGYGATADAYHITAPAPEGRGAARAMALALRENDIDPSRVSYINAHGTSTELNDRCETAAIHSVLGEHAGGVAISSTKSMIGHLLGAASGVELAVTALSIHHQRVHPTINYEVPDPECDLDYVPNEARDLEIDVALSNSLGFGGHNATIALARHDG